MPYRSFDSQLNKALEQIKYEVKSHVKDNPELGRYTSVDNLLDLIKHCPSIVNRK